MISYQINLYSSVKTLLCHLTTEVTDKHKMLSKNILKSQKYVYIWIM